MKKTSILTATLVSATLLLTGCSAAITENAKYLNEVAQVTENTLPDVDLTFVEGYGREDYSIDDAKAFLKLMDTSCMYAIKNGAIQDRGTFKDYGRDAYVVFPIEYAKEASAGYDAHWDPDNILGITHGFEYGSPLMLTEGVNIDFADDTYTEIHEAYGLELVKGGTGGSFPTIEPCDIASFQSLMMFIYETRPDFTGKPNGVVKISENLYQMAFTYSVGDADGIDVLSQHRFKDGLLESAIYPDPNGDPNGLTVLKYTYGMPPIEERQRFENLLTHRKGFLD